MKKIITALLVFILLISGVSYAEPIEYTYQKSEYEILKGLGFMKEETDLSRGVTRGEFAILTSQLFAKPQFPDSLSSAFSDVSEKGEEKELNIAVSMLYQIGVISKSDTGLFYPNREIEPDHAVKMLVSAVGLDYSALSKGGYPSGFKLVAQAKRIITDSNFYSSKTVSVASAAKAVYNALNMSISETNSFDGEYNGTKNETILSRRFGIYKTSGIVTDNSVSALNGRSSLVGDKIKVNGEIYRNAFECKGLLGKDVEIFYELDNAERNLLYAYVKPVNGTLKIMGDDINYFKNGKYNYDLNDDKTAEIALNGGFSIIYNNVALYDGSYYSDDIMKPDNGFVELLDNDGDGKYDVVFIHNFKDYIVSGVNTSTETIYNELDGSQIAVNETDTTYDIHFEDGARADLLAVTAPKAFLSIAASFDGSYVEIVVCKKLVRGEISSYSDDEYIINGTAYKASPLFTDYEEKLKIGVVYDFYINFLGYISYAKVASDDSLKLAYVFGVSSDTKSFGGYKLQLYSEDNMLITANLADKVTVGEEKLSAERAVAMFEREKEGGLSHQLIRFRFKDEFISELKFFTPDETIIKGASAFHHFGTTHTVDDSYALDADAKVFVVGGTGDTSDIIVTNPLFFGPYSFTGNQMKGTGYATNPDEPTVMTAFLSVSENIYVNYNIDTVPSEEFQFGACELVEKVVKTVIDGEEAYKLYVRNGIEKGIVYTTVPEVLKFKKGTGKYSDGDNTETVEAGDIIRFATNKDKRIPLGYLMVIYDRSESFYRPGNGNYEATSFEFAHSIIRVWLYDKVRDWYTFSFGDPSVKLPSPDKPGEFIETKKGIMLLNGASTVLIIDKKTGSIKNGSLNDMLTYKAVGDDCSDGILFNYQGSPKRAVMYIYR